MDKPQPILGEHPLKAMVQPHEIVVGIEKPHEGKMVGPYDFERPVIVPVVVLTLVVQHDGHQHGHFGPSVLVLN